MRLWGWSGFLVQAALMLDLFSAHAQASLPVGAARAVDAPVLTDAWAQDSPRQVTPSADGFLLTWERCTETEGCLTVSRRMAADGTWLDSVPTATGFRVLPVRGPAGDLYIDTNGLHLITPAAKQYDATITSVPPYDLPGSISAVANGTAGFFLTFTRLVKDAASGQFFSQVFATTIDAQGTVQAPYGVQLTSDATSHDSPTLSVGGPQALLTFRDSNGAVRVSRLTTDLVPLDASFPSLGPPGGTWIAPPVWLKDHWLELSYGQSQLANPVLLYQRISGQAQVLDATPQTLLQLPGGSTHLFETAVLAVEGDHLDLAWVDDTWRIENNAVIDDGTVKTAQVDANQQVTPAAGQTVFTAQKGLSLSLAGQNGQHVLAWTQQHAVPMDFGDRDQTEQDAFAVHLDTSLLADGPVIHLSEGDNAERAPCVSASPSGFVVIWADNRDKFETRNQELFARRFDEAGQPIDTAAFVVASAPRLTGFTCATAGQSHLVVWNDGTTSWGSVSSDGGAQSPTPFKISTGSYLPAVASDGQSFLVASPTSLGISFETVSASGALSNARYDLSGFGQGGGLSSLRLVYGGGNYLLVEAYPRGPDPSMATEFVYGLRVGPGGTELDTTPFVIDQHDEIALGRGSSYVGVASDGSGWLVVALHDPQTPSSAAQNESFGSVVARKVSAQAEVGEPLIISGAAMRPNVVWDGSAYLASFLAVDPVTFVPTSILARSIRLDATASSGLMAADAFVLEANAMHESAAVVDATHAVAAFEHFDPTLPVLASTPRVEFSLLGAGFEPSGAGDGGALSAGAGGDSASGAGGDSASGAGSGSAAAGAAPSVAGGVGGEAGDASSPSAGDQGTSDAGANSDQGELGESGSSAAARPEPSGCSCRVGHHSAHDDAPFGCLLLLTALATWRRRRSLG